MSKKEEESKKKYPKEIDDDFDDEPCVSDIDDKWDYDDGDEPVEDD